MSNWTEDARIPFFVASLLGVIAGVAAKQAVSITSGHYPRPITLLADCLVLGIVLIIVMYVHSIRPHIPLEGIALLAAALAMWGPRGISALLNRFKKGALGAAEEMAGQLFLPVEPVRRPTVAEAQHKEKDEAMSIQQENEFGKKAPVRRLRDVIPLEDQLPADELRLISEADKADPNYIWAQPLGTRKKKGKE